MNNIITSIKNIKNSEAARLRQGAPWFQWHVIWAAQDARSEALWAIRERLGLPWLAIVPLGRLPFLLGTAEYICKMPWPAAPAFVLRQAEIEAEAWMN